MVELHIKKNNSQSKQIKNPKSKFSQVFLKSTSVAQKIVDNCMSDKPDVVLEIGPGHGILTQRLVQTNVPCIVIEIDSDLTDDLQKKLGHYKNFHIINNNVLSVDLKRLIAINCSNFKKLNIVSNMPYNITGPLIMAICRVTGFRTFNRAILMMQKEVGERILSKPNSKKFGRLTASVQTFVSAKWVMNVARENFFPIPKVDSTVLEFSHSGTHDHNYDYLEHEKLLNFFKLIFTYKRKTVINNLKKYYPLKKIKSALENQAINQNARAENLSWEQMHQLFKELKKE